MAITRETLLPLVDKVVELETAVVKRNGRIKDVGEYYVFYQTGGGSTTNYVSIANLTRVRWNETIRHELRKDK